MRRVFGIGGSMQNKEILLVQVNPLMAHISPSLAGFSGADLAILVRTGALVPVGPRQSNAEIDALATELATRASGCWRPWGCLVGWMDSMLVVPNLETNSVFTAVPPS